MGGLEGRRVLVTGGSSGIGAATARAVVAAGGAVAVLARGEDRLRALAAELGAVAVPGDVRDPIAAGRAVDEAADGLGGLDAIVNAAGVMRPGRVADTSFADWRLMFEVNVLGLLAVTQAALPHLRVAELADVVNVSSLSGRRVPSATGGVYSGTKFAVHAISEGLRQELQDSRVRVSVLAPGFVRTEIFDAVAGERLGSHYREQMRVHGMDPGAVARSIVHVIGAPPGTMLFEVAMLSTSQRASGD